MSENHQLFEQGAGSARRPPGQRLRQAREQRGMTVSAVADTLRLSSAMIEALEQDRYDELPPPAFVRGYLRSYAELLGLPADEVLRAHTLSQPESVPVTQVGPVTQPLSGSHRARLVASVLGVVILALALVVVGWFSAERDAGEFDQTDTETELSRTDAAVPTQSGGTTDLARPVMAPDFEVTPGVGVEGESPPEDGADEPTLAAEHDAVIQPEGREPEVAAGEGSPPAPAESPVDTDQAAPPAATESPADTDQTRSDEVQQQPTDQQQPTERTELQIEFRIREGGRSWVEIDDAAGERIVRRLFSSGESFSAQAEAPLSIFVGDAAEVELSIDGESYDLRPHRRANNTARLIIEAGAP